jgi:hypothetical protein
VNRRAVAGPFPQILAAAPGWHIPHQLVEPPAGWPAARGGGKDGSFFRTPWMEPCAEQPGPAGVAMLPVLPRAGAALYFQFIADPAQMG